MTTFARNKDNDNPVLLFMELIGNDVCSGHPDFDHMTTVPEFRNNMLIFLDYLSKTLPKGSHVVLIGLVDGRFLYNNLHDRLHPIGYKYSQVYTFLNCLQINPCWVWMNTNETVRDTGTKRAMELNTVFPDLVKKQNYSNFDFIYYPFPLEEIANSWVAQGGELWQLIEPSDGFHPSQVTNALLGDLLAQNLLKDKPQWFGNVNPNNDNIRKMFGDQGGY